MLQYRINTYIAKTNYIKVYLVYFCILYSSPVSIVYTFFVHSC